MKNILFILSFVAVLLTTSCSENKSFIYGDVIDKHTNEVVEGCQVKLLAGDGTVISTQQTTKDGRWGFEVEAGKYSVAFSKSGYSPIQGDDIIVEHEDTQVKLVILLGEDYSEIKVDWKENSGTAFEDGDGSKEAPFVIKTSLQLQLINNYPDMHFKLADNINLNNKNWLPIEEFSGILDGNGHTIYNLHVEYKDIKERGLIGILKKGEIKNLNITGVKIAGNNAGAIAGRIANSGKISNCNVVLTDGSILRGANVGGIVGYIDCSGYSNSYSIENCTVKSESNDLAINGSYIGGIAGYANSSTSNDTGFGIINSHANCNVLGESHVGGIVGYIKGGNIIHKCGYEGKISGTENVGGICGMLDYQASTEGCKAKADIEGDNNIGGICGSMNSANVIACYSTGTITAAPGANNIGGISGTCSKVILSYSATTCTHNKFNPICNQSEGHTQNCYSVYNTQDITLKMEEAYSDYAYFWDFDNTWTWSNGNGKFVNCPRLIWENN